MRAWRWRRREPTGDERFPDPAAVFSIASGPRRRLWERRQDDPDYLLLRVGTADLPSAVTLTDPELDEHRRDVTWLVPDAPVTISLRQRGVIGVAGPGDAPRAIGRWLVAQAATLHSPSDVQICLLTDASGEGSWEWTRWLPHCRPAHRPGLRRPDRQRRGVGGGPDRRTACHRQRPAAGGGRSGTAGSPIPARHHGGASTGHAGSGRCPG